MSSSPPPSKEPPAPSNTNSNTNDPYTILNIPRDAPPSHINSAYRKQFIQCHPDRSHSQTPDEQRYCQHVFKYLGPAYEILSNKEQREAYDKYGFDYQNQNQQQQEVVEEDPFSRRFGMTKKMKPKKVVPPRRKSNMYEDRSSQEDPLSRQFGMTQNQGHPSQQRRVDPFDAFNVFGIGPGKRGPGMEMGGVQDMMNNLMNSMQDHSFEEGYGRTMDTNNTNNNRMVMSSSSSTSTSIGIMGAKESVQTQTRFVDGKKQMVVERMLVRPDGSVEKHKDIMGSEDGYE